MHQRCFFSVCLAACLLAACATSTPAPRTTTRSGPGNSTSYPSTLPEQDYRTNYDEISLFGDSAHPLTDDRVAGFKLLTGKTPVYWGRYICNNNTDYNM